LALFINLKVLGDLGVLAAELFELSVGHGRVKSTLPQLGQHVSARDFALVLAHLRLWRRFRGLRLLLADWTLLAVEIHATALKQEIEDLVLTLLLGPVRRSHALFVFHVQVGALVEEELAHLVATLLDGVVDRPLVLCICDVEVSSELNQLLNRLDVALTHSVVDSGLPIFILTVQVVSAKREKVAN